MAYCTACGALRPPLTGTSLNLVGQPSKIGGAVARVLGWIVLAVGLSIALVVGLLAQAIFPAGFAGLLIGLPLAIISLVIGVLLVRSGKSLGQSGASAEERARVQAIFGLATHRGGAVTALDVSRTLDMPVNEADALLTRLAKEQYDRVAVEIDSNGDLYYRFNLNGMYGVPAIESASDSAHGVHRGHPSHPAARVRVDAPGADGVRVDPEIAQSPNRAEWERLESEEAANAATNATRASRRR